MGARSGIKTFQNAAYGFCSLYHALKRVLRRVNAPDCICLHPRGYFGRVDAVTFENLRNTDSLQVKFGTMESVRRGA